MLSTKEEIKAALDAYRSHIAANNRRALETLIPIIANWVPNEDYDMPEEEVPLFRLKGLNRLVECWPVVRRLSDPRDLLTRWEELVPLLELDGVQRLRLPGLDEEDEDGMRDSLAVLADQEYRQLQFDEYVTTVETALKDSERILEEARATVAFPEELRILFDLGVDGLSGAGLPIWKGMFGCDFWIGPGEPVQDVASRVQGLDAKLANWGVELPSIQGCLIEPADVELGEWVVAGGWGIGDGRDAQYCCAVFCRRVDETDSKFAWRYVISDEYCARLFDTIPQLLDFYQDYQLGDMSHLVEEDANEECLFDML